MYVTLCGLNPLSGNNTNVNNAKGLTPALGVPGGANGDDRHPASSLCHLESGWRGRRLLAQLSGAEFEIMFMEMMHDMMAGMVIWWIAGILLVVLLIVIIARFIKK